MADAPRQPLQFVRDIAARVAAYIGPPGEPVYNAESKRLHVQDGATAGGTPLVSTGRRPINDAAALLTMADVYVAMTRITVPRAITLPLASAYPPGHPLYIADESGVCSYDAGLTIVIFPSGSDTIAGQSSITMGSPYQKLTFHSNGSNLWTFA